MGNVSRKKSKVGSFRVRADGTVEVRVAHGYDRNGNPRRASGVARDMAEARQLALKLAAELGRRPDLGRRLTLQEWWDAYGVGKGSRLARSTYERYRGDMRRVWLPALGGADISTIERAEVQRLLLGCPSRDYASHALRTLSAVLTQAVRDGHLHENPLRTGGFEMPGDVGAGEAPDVSDPFAAIEGAQDVWDARTVLRALPLMRGLPIETCWLAMVGAGLRKEEAMALMWKDVRRVEVGGREVTQIAVYKAYTERDGLKRTKTPQSVRIVAVVEPFGERLWELRGDPLSAVVEVSIHNMRRDWKRLFEPVTSKHAPKTGVVWKGRLAGLPYVPLHRMRATHETYMQQAGVLDSVNAAAHGHSERVSYAHYQRPDGLDAAEQAGDYLLSLVA